MDEGAVFCTGCGTNNGSASGIATADQAESGSTTVSEQPNTNGVYYQSGAQGTPSGAYYQPAAQGTPTTYSQPGAQGTPPTYTQPGAQGTQGTPYYQTSAQNTQSAPYYQPGAQGAPNTPYYQNGPYTGGPNTPGGGPKKSNKMVIIIVSIIVGIALIAGGILLYSKLSNNNNDDPDVSDNSDVSDTTEDVEPSESVEPSEDVVSPTPSIEPDETDDYTTSSSAGLDIFDAVTKDYIIAACEDTGMDITKIEDVEFYGTWFEGDVYTMTYYGSVIDILLYDDGNVFSLETNGTQIYLTGYESFLIDDYMGYMTHFDESYPDNGYAFYVNGNYVDSTVNMETSYDFDYVIEFIDANDGSMALAFFMPAGQTLQMGVPTGDYYIQYAAGVEWAGVDYLFGDDTVFYKSDSIYSFYPENDSTITLDITGGAGIPSTAITLDDF